MYHAGLSICRFWVSVETLDDEKQLILISYMSRSLTSLQRVIRGII